MKSAEWYRDTLGFQFERFWGDPPGFCIPGRDNCSVMLSRTDKPDGVHPNGRTAKDAWDAYFWIADALFAQTTAAGAEVVYPPTVKELYGMKEFAIRDYDGYVLAFGEDAAED